MNVLRALRREAWILPVILVFAGLGILPTAAALAGALDPAGLRELASATLWTRLGSSVAIAGAVCAVAVPLGLVLAWTLVRSDVPLRRILLPLSAIPLFLPPLLHALSWFGLLRVRGAAAVIIVYVVSYLPLVVLLAARSLERVSRSHAQTLSLLGGDAAVFRDDLRQAAPAALIGGGLAVVLMLSDFAVADFLTSVGPKVTVYADSLYALHQRGETGAAAAAALPGLGISLLLLALCLHARRRLGASVGSRFEPAPVVRLGRWRVPVAAAAAGIVLSGSVLPAAVLMVRTGSFETFLEQASQAAPVVGRTVLLGALAATAMVALGLPLAWRAAEGRRPWILDTLLLAPLALPALLFGIGLIRIWNRPAFDAVYLGLPVVVMAMAGRYMAFAYLPLGGAVEQIGRGVLESAELSGAGRLERLRIVVLPLAMNALAGAWCVGFCFSLREIDAFVMLRAGHDTLLFLVHRSVVFARDDEVAALALVTMLVTIAPLLAWLAVSRGRVRLL